MTSARNPGSENNTSGSGVPTAAASCRRFRVTGRVQGVFFRDSTRQVARRLDLTGYAKNQQDGSVEVMACGREEALDELADWLRSGPPMASVDKLEAAVVDDLSCDRLTYDRFAIK